jgi:hypothetical protein
VSSLHRRTLARLPPRGTSHNTRFTLRALRALAPQMVHKSLHVKGADNQLSAQLAFARSAPALVVVNLCTLSEMACGRENTRAGVGKSGP